MQNDVEDVFLFDCVCCQSMVTIIYYLWGRRGLLHRVSYRGSTKDSQIQLRQESWSNTNRTRQSCHVSSHHGMICRLFHFTWQMIQWSCSQGTSGHAKFLYYIGRARSQWWMIQRSHAPIVLLHLFNFRDRQKSFRGHSGLCLYAKVPVNGDLLGRLLLTTSANQKKHILTI